MVDLERMRGETIYIGVYKIRHVYVDSTRHVRTLGPFKGIPVKRFNGHDNHWAITLDGKHIDSALTKRVAMKRARSYGDEHNQQDRGEHQSHS